MTAESPLQKPFQARISDWLHTLRHYLSLGHGRRRDVTLDDPERLREFLDTRASFIAQTSLYGYLRTRAGMRYPELFDDQVFVDSINIAKWHMWLACLSDIGVFAGGLLANRQPGSEEEAKVMVSTLVRELVEEKGHPEEADDEFPAHARKVIERMESCDFSCITDDEACFSESPEALVRWAPIVDQLKQLDAEIVRNSVRFHWQEVRRDLRRNLDAQALLAERQAF